MKNTFRLLVVVALGTMLFTSCKKETLEGQYMPDKKPSVIRSANLDNDGAESFVQVSTFHWDGKLLSDIETTSGLTGNGLSKTSFTYDSKKRVEKITVQSDVVSIYKLVYDEKELTKVEGYFDSNVITDEYLFTKSDGKVTQITHISFDKSSKKGDFEPLRYFFPEQIVMAMETASKVADKADRDVTSLIWDGDNIIKTEMEASVMVTTDYTYDNKVNPLKGLYKGNFESTPEILYSANNVISSTMEMPIIGTMRTTHTYEYDGDYPVKDVIETSTMLTNTKTVVTYTYL